MSTPWPLIWGPSLIPGMNQRYNLPIPKSQKRGLAWGDPDDPDLRIALGAIRCPRKRRDTAAQGEIGGWDYERCPDSPIIMPHLASE